MVELLIVDDEPVIVDGIEEMLLSTELPLKQISKAYSASQALELYRNRFYDIVISDIRMPEMDGLAMVGRMRELWAGIKVIFLTGFRDFDYAREALRLQSADYLLKPVSDEDLESAISKVIVNLEQEMQEAIRLENIRSGFNNMYFDKQSSLFTELIDEKWIHPSLKLRENFKGLAISLSPDVPVSAAAICYDTSPDWPVARMHHAIANALEEFLPKDNQSICCQYQAQTTFVFYQSHHEVIEKRMEELQSFLCEKMRVVLSIGIERSISWDHFSEAARSLLKHISNAGPGCFLRVDRTSAGGEDDMTRSAYIIDVVKEYIRENLERDLSLSALADKFHINPSYLSRVFRQVAGIQLSSYISCCRMEEAKHILLSSEIRITDVGKMVGFENTNYFSKVFVKHVGILPRDYRLASR